MAKLNQPHPELLHALTTRAGPLSTCMTPQGLANMAWALATLQAEVDKELLQEIEAAAVGSLQRSTPQAITNTLWGLVTLDHAPSVRPSHPSCPAACCVYVFIHHMFCGLQGSCSQS